MVGEGGEEIEDLLKERGLARGRADGAAGGEHIGERRLTRPCGRQRPKSSTQGPYGGVSVRS